MGVGKTTIGTYIADHVPGTALIDGDWCMDIHPFVGNSDTKALAVDNILHLVGNYQKCTYCSMVVMVWLMDDPWVIKAIMDGLSALRAQVKIVTLVCDRDVLTRRWNNDQTCKWRTDTWLSISLKSLPTFTAMKNVIDTSHLSVEQVAELIME